MPDNTGMRLLTKRQKGLFHHILGRTGLVLLLLVLKALYLLALFLWFEDYLIHFSGIHFVVSLSLVLYLFNSRLDPMAKLTWLVIVIPLPIFGGLLFLFTQSELGLRTMKHRLRQLEKAGKDTILQDDAVFAAFEKENPGAAAMARYVATSGCYPLFQCGETVYFPQGEDKFERLLTELKNAQKYIYLEYFIINEGLMWGKILEILVQKAAEGLDVRVMYDGTCELALLPKSYPQKLRRLGIRCKVFSPATPFLSTHYNYRDHRKILVIDGNTAFTGGINLSDEYINRGSRFGHWKDTAVMVRGDAARSFARMFLQLWDLTEKVPSSLPEPAATDQPANGFILPYSDSPLDGEKVGKRVYIDLLSRARRYVHIMTPYLILDAELENALIYAAKRGVEVTLLLPGIPDKHIPYALAKSHYPALLGAGVRIFEYIPGFVHAKVFVADDIEAVVGTINLDYRSLYHHFECAAYLYGVDCVGTIEADFVSTLEKCRTISQQTIKKEKWWLRLTGYIMKLAAPLL